METQMIFQSVIKLVGKIAVEQKWERFCSTPRSPDEMGRILLAGNYGVPCGPANNLLIIDVDDPELFKKWSSESIPPGLPPTYTVKTAKGYHLYYQYPSTGEKYGNRSFKAAGFDIRGMGGYVVGEGCVHPETGAIYTAINTLPCSPFPEKILAMYAPQERLKEVGDTPDAEWWDGKIENLPVPDRIKNLIMGALSEKDRSTDMMAVINQLAYCKLSDSQIYQIFAENPIGDKSREKNDPEKWLKPQIDNGRDFAAAELGFYTTPQEDFGTPVAPPGPSENYFTKISVRERPPEIPWVFNGLLPRGAVGFVAAVGGTGKSYLLLELAMRSVFGLSSFDAFHPVKPLKVFVVMVEDPEVITLGRIYDIASTLPGSMEDVETALDERFRLRCVPIGTLAAFNRGNPSATKAHQELKLQIEAFNPDLIILDPKSQLYGLDENNNDHNTFWVNLLKDLIDKIRALLFAHHMPKMGSAFDVAGARGGSALADASRLVIGIEHLSEKLVTDFGIDDPTQYAHMRFTKCSYAPLPNGDVFLKRTETGRLERCYPQNLSCHIIVNLLCEALECHYADGGGNLTERQIVKEPIGKNIRDSIKEKYPSATRIKISDAVLTGISTGKLISEDVLNGVNVCQIIKTKTLAGDWES